jgi:acetate kinase
MKILSLNCGSSSLKYQLFDMSNESVLAKGLCERIGAEGSVLVHSVPDKDKVKLEKPMPTHKEAIELVLSTLMDEKLGVIKNADEIDAVGHRVLHGGEYFKQSVVVDEDAKEKMKKCIPLGPLHMPANIMGIEACEQVLAGKPNVAVFDTSFHQTMPDYAYMYAIPYEDYKELHVRKYGFHGTSHKFISSVASELIKDKVKGDSKVIICHLGNGSSVSAVKNGKCVDTSMGLTPLEGLMMGTRAGNIDAAAVLYIMKNKHFTTEEMDAYLNKKSGILGVFGESSDCRDLDAAYKEGNERATLAMNMLCYKITQYIGNYAAVLGGVDALCFTGGIGENDAFIRAKVCEGLEFMGIEIDAEKNKARGKLALVSKDSAKASVYVIPTNEELMIARETLELTK